MQCEEAQELITAWVDDELSTGERGAVEAHLRHCAACRPEFERESILKRRVRLAGLQISAPAKLRRLIEEKSLAATAIKKTWSGRSLRGRFALPNWRRREEKGASPTLIKKTSSEWSFRGWLPMPSWRRIEEKSAALAFVKRARSGWSLRGRFAWPKWWRREENSATPTLIKKTSSEWSFRGWLPMPSWRCIEESAALAFLKKAWSGWSFQVWLALPSWRRALISAMLVSIVALVIYTREHDEKSKVAVATEAFEIHAAIVSGKTALLPAVNLAAMRKELAHAVGDRFKPVVLDLSLMKLYPVAGFVQNLGGRDLLVTVYQGDGPAVTCFTFLGSETDAPQEAERFYDAKMRINYFSYSHGDLNGVLHQEGDVICLLVSNMAPADLLALLRRKSAHA